MSNQRPSDFVRQEAVQWIGKNAHGKTFQRSAVIIAQDDDKLVLVPVYATDTNTKCYDDGGANYETDRDNVLLRHCPPPFTQLCNVGVRGCYARADISHPITLTADDVIRLDVQPVDDGILINDKDMKEIMDHPWREELQKNKPVTLANSVSTDAEAKPEKQPVTRSATQQKAFEKQIAADADRLMSGIASTSLGDDGYTYC